MFILSSFCYGYEMGNLGIYAGLVLSISGLGYLISTLIEPQEQVIFKTEKIFFENSMYEPPSIVNE